MFNICSVVIISLVGVKNNIVYWLNWYVVMMMNFGIFIVLVSGVKIGIDNIVNLEDDGMIKFK